MKLLLPVMLVSNKVVTDPGYSSPLSVTMKWWWDNLVDSKFRPFPDFDNIDLVEYEKDNYDSSSQKICLFSHLNVQLVC